MEGKRQFFKSLRKDLIQEGQIIMEIHHIKQILFIDSSLFICTRQMVKDHAYDILLDLSSTDRPVRKVEFREKFQRYVRSQKRRIMIPQKKFVFEQKIENNNHLICLKQEEELAETQQEEAKQKSERIRNIKMLFNKNDLFNLYKAIQEKEAKERERKKKGERKYGRAEVLKVMDELFLIKSLKKIYNMFKVSLVELIGKNLIILDTVIDEIIEFMISIKGGYLKIIYNTKLTILQADINKFYSYREKILEIKFQQ